MKFLIPILLFFLAVNCQPVKKSAADKGFTSAKVLKHKLKKKPFLVDVRTPPEFASGSVDGAINIPLDEVQERISEFKGKKNIVIFCRTGRRSDQAISILKENGIDNVSNGISAENIEKVKTVK